MPAAPVKRAPAKKAAPRKPATPPKPAEPGDVKFDWRKIYPAKVPLFKFVSDDGFVLCLPKFTQPGEGEVLGLMLFDKSEQELMIQVMRDHITEKSFDGDAALYATYATLKRFTVVGTVEQLLREWPKASGVELGKS